MIATRGGPTFMELDERASADNRPHLLVTADCSNPRELDDGLIVEALPSSGEMYRVSVCVVDTSPLYREHGVLDEVMKRTEAKYYPLPNGEQGYEPMVSGEVIKDMDFKLRSPGDTRAAMIVRFVVGKNQPPTDTEVVFGQVEVAANHDYHHFAALSSLGGKYERFGRAAILIKQHLAFTAEGDHYGSGSEGAANAGSKRIVTDPVHQGFIRGSRLNEAFMVGTCLKVGQLLIPEQDRVGIYRVHDSADEAQQMFLPANVATYSWEPGPHEGLGVYGYCRVTSPLRRLEDFIMSHLLRQRYEGKPVTRDDEATVAMAVHRLNGRIQYEYSNKPIKHLKGQALLGRKKGALGKIAQVGVTALPVREDYRDAASA